MCMKSNSKIQYCYLTQDEVYTKMYQEAHSDAYAVYWRGKRCLTDSDIFREASASFQFPDYFGENWPALDECITDLEWIKFTRIFLLIDDFDKMFAGDTAAQRLLIKHLNMWIDDWATQGITFEVWVNHCNLLSYRNSI